MGTPAYVEPAGAIAPMPQLPGGGYKVFGHHRFLVAYYGTAQTGAIGIWARPTRTRCNVARCRRHGRSVSRGNRSSRSTS